MPGPPPQTIPADKRAAILDGLYGGRDLRGICRDLGIHPSTVSHWRSKDEAFRAEYDEAREAGAHVLLDEAQALADEGTAADAPIIKLRCYYREQRAARYCPRVFGQNAKIEHTGSLNLGHVDRATAAEEMAAMLAVAAARKAGPTP